MQYAFPIPIPANTEAKDPVRVATPLNAGKLVYCAAYFPWGCAGLAGVRFIHHEHQLYPTNQDEWQKGNDLLVEFDCAYDIEDGWKYFKVEGYNEDDLYPHTPIAFFVVLPVSGLFKAPATWLQG